MHRNVPFYRHDLAPQDAARIAEVLATPMLTSGAVGKSVEAQLRTFFGVGHAGLVNSWTNGAVAALLALDVGPGDEVIVPAMTFIATANAAELVGAKPVFVDVDPDTLLLSPAAMRAALGPRTRAVIPVHLYGQMADIGALRATLDEAGRQDVRLIEDAAHCFEGSLRGERPGARSDIAIFSFYATKNVTCGEGGAYVTNSDEIAERMAQTRLHGMSAGAADRFRQGAYRHWDMTRLGTKANLPDLLAALLPPQIDTIQARLARRATLAARYDAALADLPRTMCSRSMCHRRYATRRSPRSTPPVSPSPSTTAPSPRLGTTARDTGTDRPIFLSATRGVKERSRCLSFRRCRTRTRTTWSPSCASASSPCASARPDAAHATARGARHP